MRILKPNNEEKVEKAEERGFAAGCMGILFEVAVWVFSTIFVTIGGAMFVFGILSLEPELTSATVFALIAVPVAIAFFIRTGRAIIRDLRNPK